MTTMSIWDTRSTTSTACSMANCTCRKVGPKIARVVALASALPTRMVYRPKRQICALELYECA